MIIRLPLLKMSKLKNHDFIDLHTIGVSLVNPIVQCRFKTRRMCILRFFGTPECDGSESRTFAFRSTQETVAWLETFSRLNFLLAHCASCCWVHGCQAARRRRRFFKMSCF